MSPRPPRKLNHSPAEYPRISARVPQVGYQTVCKPGWLYDRNVSSPAPAPLADTLPRGLEPSPVPPPAGPLLQRTRFYWEGTVIHPDPDDPWDHKVRLDVVRAFHGKPGCGRPRVPRQRR